MPKSINFEELDALLPENARENFDEIWRETAGSEKPLMICLGGEYSAGKTTLLNNLLGENLLPVAIEECTALPTFVEYGPKPIFTFAGADGAIEVERENLANVILDPPANSRFLQISLPQNWLRGVELVDLPGSGSLDPLKKGRGQEMLRKADAVIYLFNSRGPAKPDIANLRLLQSLGKNIFLGVTHWDEVQEAAKSGEKMPDLAQWSSQIENETGIRAPITPIDRNGLGTSEILDFILKSLENLAEEREKRFRVEALPYVANLLESAKADERALAAAGTEEERKLYDSLLAEKEKLLQLQAELQEKENAEKSTLFDKFDKASEEGEERLLAGLKDLEPLWQNDASREKYLREGQNLLEQSLANMASSASSLAKTYGALDLPETLLEETRICLAPPIAPEIGEFLDTARYAHLQDMLERLIAREKEAKTQDREFLPAIGNLDQMREEAWELKKMRDELAASPLPTITITEKPDGSGKILGRMLGEIADLALIWALPATAASKAGSYAGKAAKACGIAAKTAKTFGKAVTTTAQTVKTAHEAAAQKRKLPVGVAGKLALLDGLTLGYWGEKIGSYFDGPPKTRTQIDQNAMRELEMQLAEVDSNLKKKRLEIAALERAAQRAGKGDNPAEISREIAALREELAKMENSAENKRKAAIARSEEEYRAMLDYEKNKCLREWQIIYQRQCRAMRALLAACFKNWWEEYVPATLGEARKRIAETQKLLSEAPEKRAERAASIKGRMDNLQKALKLLNV